MQREREFLRKKIISLSDNTWDFMDYIKKLPPPALPYNLDDKIFYRTDEEGNQIGEPYSYNDWLKMLKDISGVDKELLGPSDNT